MKQAKKRKTIVVVEDEIALQKVLVEWLESEGFRAVGITDGQEALEQIPRILPDLVFLDIILPHRNGFEVLEEISKNPKSSHIPVIVLTNLGDYQERKKALELGAKSYLIKADYDFVAMKKVIKEILADSSL